jgi:hypothetical protein
LEGNGGEVGNGTNPSLDISILDLKASRSSKNYGVNALDFKVDAKLEEISRNSGEVALEFELKIITEPEMATFHITGQVKVQGEQKDIERILATDPDNQVPILMSEIYSQIYSVIYILAAGISVPYPAAGLLYSDHKLPIGKTSLDQDSAMGSPQKKQAEEAASTRESSEAAPQATG